MVMSRVIVTEQPSESAIAQSDIKVIERQRKPRKQGRGRRFWLSSLVGLVLVSGFLVVYFRYTADIRTAEERVYYGTAVVETAAGPIEYADIGQGRPLLAIHGTGGGFDQGLLLVKGFGINQSEYRIIAPSRYGYLRTPFPPGATNPA